MALGANDGPANAGKDGSLRRSQRVCLNVDVEVVVQRGKEKSALEQTKTLIVSAHGALILLRTPVTVGDKLRLRHVVTTEEMNCRVMDVNVGNAGMPEIGLEFLQPQRNFWRIAFPPADWSPRGPESKVSGPQVVAGLPRTPKP